MKTVLATGAAQGLGLTVATLLAQRAQRVPANGGWTADGSWDALRLRTR